MKRMDTRAVVYCCIICFLLSMAETFGQDRDATPRPPDNRFSAVVPDRSPSPEGSPSTATVTLTSSNLPIVVIDTHGQTIKNEPKITANMKIIFNDPPGRNYVSDPGNIYSGYVGVEIRGSYSAILPQKPYGFETRDGAGNNLSVPILNMPSENDWILLANYNDKVFMRNTLAFDLFAKMGHYQPHTRLCEVIVNNDYQGIYVLTEKIKQDKNRVHIPKLTAADTVGDNLTGGYIIKIDNGNFDGSDGWRSNFEAIDCPGTGRYPYFIYSYPKPGDIVNQQKQYIQEFIGKIDSILRSPQWADPEEGYRAYLDVASFIDVFIVGEVSRNVDTYKKSAFFYKDKDSTDRRLHAGPVWDFDWAWKNMNGEWNANTTDGSGWMFGISSDGHTHPVPPGWAVKLLEDTTFANELHARYSLLRKTILSEEFFNHYIDSIQTLVDEAQVRHYEKWPILGGPPEGAPEVDYQPTTFAGEITKFKDWIWTRLSWLDESMPGRDIQGIAEPGPVTIPEEFALMQNFPNPFNPQTTISYSLPGPGSVTLKVYDIVGREIETLVHNEKKGAGTYVVSFDAVNLPSGVYFYRLQTEKFLETKKMILLK